MSVKLRLLLLVLVAALPVFLLTAWYEVVDRRQWRSAAEQQLLRSVRLLAAQQDQFFQRADSTLTAMLVAVSDSWSDTAACNAYLIRLAERNPAYTGFGVATPDGTIVCSSLPERLLGVNLAERDYFQDVLASGGFSIGGVQTGISSGRAIAGLATPLLDEAGSVELVGVSGLDLAGLSGTISAAVSSPGVGVVFDGNGTIVARSPEPERWVGQSVTPQHLEVARTGGGVVESEGVDEERRLWAVSALLPQKGIYASIGVPAADLFAQANRLFWMHIGLLCLVFTAAAIAAVFMGERAIRRPIDALESAVARLRKGDLAARSVGVGSAPEFVHLGQSFNEMAERLQEHEGELAQLVSQRELLIREMNHRVKNSLQMVSGLIGLQRSAFSDPHVKAKLADAQARIAAIAKVHERLYTAEQLDQVDAGRYLAELCREITDSTALEAAGGEIRCRADNVAMPPDQAIPLGIIATELATNAIKHAYPEGGGRVDVELAEEDGGWRLSVSDRGAGVPAGFEAEAHTGLGMKVVRALTQQLGARMEVRRLEPGTAFVIVLAEADEPDEPDEAGEPGAEEPADEASAAPAGAAQAGATLSPILNP